MMRKTMNLLILAMLLAAAPASAHHGWGNYDTGRPLYLAGRVTHVSWRNPHPEVTIEATETMLPADWGSLPVPPELTELGFNDVLAKTVAVDGPGPWVLDLAPLNRLQRWGMPREPQIGDTMIGIGFPSCSEDGVIRPALIVLDGTGVRQQSVALPTGCSSGS